MVCHTAGGPVEREAITAKLKPLRYITEMRDVPHVGHVTQLALSGSRDSTPSAPASGDFAMSMAMRFCEVSRKSKDSKLV